MPPARRKLPIGVQTFAKIRSEDYYYSAPMQVVEFLNTSLLFQS